MVSHYPLLNLIPCHISYLSRQETDVITAAQAIHQIYRHLGKTSYPAVILTSPSTTAMDATDMVVCFYPKEVSQDAFTGSKNTRAGMLPPQCPTTIAHTEVTIQGEETRLDMMTSFPRFKQLFTKAQVNICHSSFSRVLYKPK